MGILLGFCKDSISTLSDSVGMLLGFTGDSAVILLIGFPMDSDGIYIGFL